MTYATGLGYTPIFSISKDGEDITGHFTDRLTSITVSSYEGGGDSDTADVVIDDRDWAVQAPSIGEGSAVLKIALGYKEGGLYDMGTFQVDEIHFRGMPKAIVLQGNSLGANTNAKAPVVTSYQDKTLGDFIGSIAQAAGVSPVVDPSLASIKVPYLNQHCSHQHLLQELESRFNALAKFEDGHLSFTHRGTGLTASGGDFGTFTLGPDDLKDWDVKSNNFNAYSKVRASYIDRTINQQVWVTSNTSGAPGSTVPFMMKKPYGSQAEAQAAADSMMLEKNRGTKQVTFDLVKGNPSIRGGMKFTVAGCRPGIDDTYIVRCATHRLTKDDGLSTSLDCYNEDAGSDTSTGDEAPTTAPSLDEMAAGTSTVPLGQGGIGHQ